MLSSVVFASFFAQCVGHNVCNSSNSCVGASGLQKQDQAAISLLQKQFLIQGAAASELTLPLSASSLPNAKEGIKIFCYSLVKDPRGSHEDPAKHEEDITDFEKNLALGCDGWALFSTAADKNKSVIQAYPPTKAGENFFTRNDTFLHVWTEHIKLLLNDFDYFVKLDSDSAVRPVVFRQMLMQHDATKPLVLSVEECHPYRTDKRSDGVCVDGYFVAVSKEAAQRILGLQRPEDCRLASFGDFEGDGDDEHMLKRCVEATGIQFEEPLDAAGCHLIPFDREGCPDVMPISAQNAQVLAAGKLLSGSVEATSSKKTCCYSPDMVTFHGVRAKENWQMLRRVFHSENF